MFSFFGGFADQHSGIAEKFRQQWQYVDLVGTQVQQSSREYPSVRFVLLRTELLGVGL